MDKDTNETTGIPGEKAPEAPTPSVDQDSAEPTNTTPEAEPVDNPEDRGAVDEGQSPADTQPTSEESAPEEAEKPELPPFTHNGDQVLKISDEIKLGQRVYKDVEVHEASGPVTYRYEAKDLAIPGKILQPKQ